MRSKLMLGIAVLVAASGLAFAQSAQPGKGPTAAETIAASPCTKLPEPECTNLSACAWIPGFKLSTGAEVKGYCRAAPKPLNARRPPSPQ